MRRLLCLLFMILPLFMLHSVDELDSEEFLIRAYKLDTSYSGYEFVVTDALSDFSHLNRVEKGETLLLDDYIPWYLGDPEEPPSQFSEMIIFSYRVASKWEGNFAVNLTFFPFEYNGNTITAGYELGNVNYIFESTSTSTSSDGSQITGSVDPAHIVVDDAAGTLRNTWNVTTKANDRWIVR